MAAIIMVESMMTLRVKELMEELKLRGQTISDKKKMLQARLREAIEQNIPVSTTAAPPEHKCGNYSYNNTPIPEPINIDASPCPPTERGGALNPKYGFQEKFEKTTL